MNGLSLFSGIGGIDVALSEYVRPIAYCEIDPYCQGVLLSRMEDKRLPTAPIWDDVRTLGKESGNFPRFFIDIIYGGFPCQGISVAGLGKGLEDERSGLFFEIVRLAEEIRPKFIFLENVPAITSRGGLTVSMQIAEMGYDCRWCVISAASVGALHRRERWFLLAHAKHDGTPSSQDRRSVGERSTQGKEQGQQTEGFGETERASGLSSDVANSEGQGCKSRGNEIGNEQTKSIVTNNGQIDGDTDSIASEQADTSTESNQGERNTRRGSTRQYWPFESREHWQEVVSTIRRVDDGVPYRVDKLRCLGNAVVHIQVKEAFEILMGIKNRPRA